MLIAIILGLLAIITYLKLIKPCKYWQNKGIPHLKPWPFIGNMAENLLGTRSFAYLIQDMYEKFPNERYFGFHHYSKPTIMLRDPELIKQICVKDIDVFPDHAPFLPNDGDPFFNKNLLGLKGRAWKRMRTTVSPAFTSSKLKTMFEVMKECSSQFIKYFEQNGGDHHVDVRDLFIRLTNDVSVSLILGVRCDSINDRENQLYSMGKKFLSGGSIFKIFGYAISPTLMKLFKVTFFHESIRALLSQIVQTEMQRRKTENVLRPDMLHLLIQAKVDELKKGNTRIADEDIKRNEFQNDDLNAITDEDIIAQAAIFYGGGIDTSSNLLSVLAYELAVNPDAQETLRNEIDSTLKECDGELTYEALMGMKYLDMVVAETLRLWPVTIFTDRISVKPYVIEASRPGEKSLEVDVGTYVWLPLYSIQRDPKYFSNPEKFDPERFNNENKNKILPCTYIPFGFGPRNCVASRFALVEAKALLFYTVSKFEVLPVAETQIPYTLNKKALTLESDKKLVLRLKLRTCV